MKDYSNITYNELAVLFKKIIYTDASVEYIPERVIEGTYNEEIGLFIDKNGTPYNNVIENPNGYGYLFRDYMGDLRSKYPNIPVSLLKIIVLRSAK